MEMEAQYDDEMRDTRTLRQKVYMYRSISSNCQLARTGFSRKCVLHMVLPIGDLFLFVLLFLLKREAESKTKVYDKKCEKRLTVSMLNSTFTCMYCKCAINSNNYYG